MNYKAFGVGAAMPFALNVHAQKNDWWGAPHLAGHCAAVSYYLIGESQGDLKASYQKMMRLYLTQCSNLVGDAKCVQEYKLHKILVTQMKEIEFRERAQECINAIQ